MNLLIINGHPRENSLSDAFATAYCQGAQHTLSNVKCLNVRDLTFNPNVYHNEQEIESDLVQAREFVKWAEHIVFIYPTWWGTVPALLKGFIDRVFISGFAFQEIDGGTGYAPLLTGRTAQLITTMDTPYFVYKWIYKAPGDHAMRKATLEFCGFYLVRNLHFGPVKKSTETQRLKWIERVRKEAEKMHSSPISSWAKIQQNVFTWLKAFRLQFYPMTFIAYTIGALAAKLQGFSFDTLVFWLGYLFLFLVEVATVLTNEYYDFATDKINKYYSLFTGGSRVIVEKQLSYKEVRMGIIFFLCLSIIPFSFLLLNMDRTANYILVICGIIVALALSYTLPPLKLSYRGLGELTVGITHSFAMIICGFIFQGGSAWNPLPWTLSIPLFFSILPSIIVAGCPDYVADKAVKKHTVAVLLGRKEAARLALLFTWISPLSVLLLDFFGHPVQAYNGILFFSIPHAMLLTMLLKKYIATEHLPNRIDSIMATALTYLIWFGVLPLFNLF